MKDAINEKAVSVKNHIIHHRAKYASAATLVVCYKLHRVSVKQWYAFLEEKGIDPTEFLLPEHFAEMHS
jgi:hypothetical protein